MSRVMVGVVACAMAVACSKTDPPKPLREAIVGPWDRWCAIEDRTATKCPGKETYGLYKVLRSGGALETGSRKTEVRERGTWTLHGDRLTLVIGTGSVQLTERWIARVVDDRLIL